MVIFPAEPSPRPAKSVGSADRKSFPITPATSKAQGAWDRRTARAMPPIILAAAGALARTATCRLVEEKEKGRPGPARTWRKGSNRTNERSRPGPLGAAAAAPAPAPAAREPRAAPRTAPYRTARHLPAPLPKAPRSCPRAEPWIEPPAPAPAPRTHRRRPPSSPVLRGWARAPSLPPQ